MFLIICNAYMTLLSHPFPVSSFCLRRNLWNFNPIHIFTDSSGMYWRERRLTPGLYTDGKVVYESAYRYTDGRAGMKPVSNLDAFLQSSTIKRDVKEDLLKRLKNDSPDVVVEE